MRNWLVGFGLGLALATGAAGAAEIGGTYRVEGTNFDGSRYTGTATITPTADLTCDIQWQTGSTADGICMLDGDVLAASYVMGKSVGLVVYRILDDGTLEGRWTIAGQQGVGTEVLHPN